MQSGRGLWRQADFLRLWSGQTISELGSRITRDGLPLVALLVLGASPSQMGVIAALGSAVVLLISLPAGVWVDRLRRKPIMIAADLGRALLVAEKQLAAGHDAAFMQAKIATARFYADHILTRVPGTRDAIVDGAQSVTALALEAF